MDLLDKQLSKLHTEIKDVASETRQLYDQLDSEEDSQKQKRLEARILKLDTEKSELNARCEKLDDKLQPAGIPSKG